MQILKLMCGMAIAALLAGCANPAASVLVAQTTSPVTTNQIAGNHEIFVATTREPSSNPNEAFTGERSTQTGYAKVAVSVPAAHKTGQIEIRPGRTADPSRYLTATNVSVFSRSSWDKALRADIARNGGRALVFIHGYNNGFDFAVYRMTQIVHDAGYRGTPVLFTWASRGRALDYVYDNNSATVARDALEDTLRMVAAAGATRIDIIGHSMGTWATMEALRQLAVAGDGALGGKLGDVILASPDIDVDVFRAQMQRYGKPSRPFVVLLSEDDKALRFAARIAGKARVGDYANAKELADMGVVVVDLSQVRGDRMSHVKFAENPVLIKLIGDTLNRESGDRPSQRDMTSRVDQLSRTFGETLGTAAEIVITTPVDVLRIVVGR